MTRTDAYANVVPYYYDQYLAPYLFEPYAQGFVKQFSGKRLANVLELACGTGRLTRHLVKQLSAGGKVVATDIDSDMLEYAIKSVLTDDINWMIADAQELPFVDERFVYVLCQFGVMFFKDKLKAFKEAYRVMKPGGTFLFSVWDSLEYNPRSDLISKILKEILKDEAPDFTVKGPYSYHDTEDITITLFNAGFRSVNINIIPKISSFKSNDELIKGFVEGSPLSSFLNRRPPEIRRALEKRLHEELNAQFNYYGWDIPMQAIIVRATK